MIFKSEWECPICKVKRSELPITKTKTMESSFFAICTSCNTELFFDFFKDGSFFVVKRSKKPEINLAKSVFGVLGVLGIFIGFSLSNGLYALLGCVSIFIWSIYPNKK
jgi:hypothetical protein